MNKWQLSVQTNGQMQQNLFKKEEKRMIWDLQNWLIVLETWKHATLYGLWTS